jgi:YesN/AraC family two-component response regulator
LAEVVAVRPASSGAPDATITVLLVDDEPAILRAIVRALHASPFEVLAVESAAEALSLMRERRVDVLVTDIDMPEMSGLELVKLVRRELPATLRIVLTGAATMARALEAINEGEVHRFFSKPFDLDLFNATLRGLADRIQRLRREGELETRKARRDELYRWIEHAFPGTLDIVRDEGGRIVVDPPIEDVQLLDRPPSPRS